MKQEHAPQAVAGQTRRPANSGSRSEPAGSPAPAKRGLRGSGAVADRAILGSHRPQRVARRDGKAGTRTVRHSPRVAGVYSYLGVADLQVCGLMVSSTRGRTGGAQSGERRGRPARRLRGSRACGMDRSTRKWPVAAYWPARDPQAPAEQIRVLNNRCLSTPSVQTACASARMTGRFLGPGDLPCSIRGEPPRSARKDTDDGRTVHPRRHKRLRRGRRGSSQLAGSDPRRGRGERCVSGSASASGRAW